MKTLNLEKTHIYFSTNKQQFISTDKLQVLSHRDFSFANYEAEMLVVGESHLMQIQSLPYQEAILHEKFHNPTLSFNIKELYGCVYEGRIILDKSSELVVKIDITDFDKNLIHIYLNKSFVSHEFSDFAITAAVLSDNNKTVKTLHSYPEFDKIILSETKYIDL